MVSGNAIVGVLVGVTDGKQEWQHFPSINEAKPHALWGTFGKHGAKHCQGKCPLHQLRWVRLVDCDTPHLFAILATQWQLAETAYPEIIGAILNDRGFSNSQIEDAVEAVRSV